jgi:hypothetical protein
MFVGSGLFGAASLTTLSLAKDARAATLSCAYPAISDSVRAYFEAMASTLDQVIEKMPDAPGLYDLERLADIYPAEPGSEDDRLLQGALYLQAQSLFEMVAVPPSVDQLAEKLSKPLGVDRLDREYFGKLLATTKERAASDEAYAKAVSAAGDVSVSLTIPCRGWLKWLCVAVAVAIIVLIFL